jgi:uncharacterized protein YdaU (DUF1376 family)
MAHSPAFQYYYKDFRQDPNTIRMTTVEVGAYWLLINECWDKDNKLPKDLDSLADIARMPVEAFEVIWERAIKRCFKERKTFYWHKRLAEEIEKQKEWSAKHSNNGKKGAEKRWANARENKSFSEKIPKNSNEKSTGVKPNEDNDLQNSPAIALPSVAIANDSSSSSSSSSTSNKEKESPIGDPKKTAKRGTRISEPFMLTSPMREWARSKCPTVDINTETEKFVNHFRQKTGKDATSLDWEARWRNWIMNARDRFGGNANGSGQRFNTNKRTDADVFEESADFYRNYSG